MSSTSYLNEYRRPVDISGAHRRRRRGISLIEAALALAVIAVSLGGLATLITEATSSLQTRAHAERLGHVANAAALYVDTQKSKLDTFFSADPSGTVTVPVARQTAIGGQPTGTNGFPSLQEAGLLPSGFVDKDIFDQNLVVLIRRSSTGTRDVLLTAIGGRPLSDSQLARIASAVGAAGGAVYDDLTRNPDTHIVGTASGWSYPVASWEGKLNGTTVQPSTGRPAVAITMDRAATPQGGTFLSRVATSDAADTRMASDLDMGGKSIPNVASVIATGNLDTQGQVNAQQYVWSKNGLYTEGNLFSRKDITSEGNVGVSGAINSQQYIWSKSGLYTEGNVWSRKDITSEGSIGVNGTIWSKQGLYTDGNSSFQRDLWIGRWLHSEGGIGTHGSIQVPRGNVSAVGFCDANGANCFGASQVRDVQFGYGSMSSGRGRVSFPRPYAYIPSVFVAVADASFANNCRGDSGIFQVWTENVTRTGFDVVSRFDGFIGGCGGSWVSRALWIAN